MAGLLS